MFVAIVVKVPNFVVWIKIVNAKNNVCARWLAMFQCRPSAELTRTISRQLVTRVISFAGELIRCFQHASFSCMFQVTDQRNQNITLQRE